MKGLLDTIRASFSRELIGHLAARLGEGEKSIGMALGGIVPVLLSGLIAKAGAGEAQLVFERSQHAYLAVRSELSSVTGMLEIIGSSQPPNGIIGQGESALETLFGYSGSGLAGPISQHAGIRVDAAVALIGMVGAALPALLGQYAAARHLTAGGTAAALARLKRPVRRLLPQSLRELARWPGPNQEAPTGANSGAGRCRLKALRWYAGVGLGQHWRRFLPVLVGLVIIAWCLDVAVRSSPIASRRAAGGVKNRPRLQSPRCPLHSVPVAAGGVPGCGCYGSFQVCVPGSAKWALGTSRYEAGCLATGSEARGTSSALHSPPIPGLENCARSALPKIDVAPAMQRPAENLRRAK